MPDKSTDEERVTPGQEIMAQRLTRLQTLTYLNQIISSSLEIEKVLTEIVKATARLMDAQIVTIWEADETTQILELKTFSDEKIHEDFRVRKMGFNQGGAGLVATHRQPISIPDVFVDKRIVNHDWWKTHGLKSFFGYPIFLEHTLVAVLGLGSQEPLPLEPEDEALLNNLAAQSAIAIKNTRLFAETKRLQTQLLESKKMEAIATLAGGVAHEFNNALMGIMGNIELLKMDLPEDERRDKSFEAMNESGHRMSRLTDQLLAYSEGLKYNPKDLKLDDFVIETLPILQYDLSPEVRVETHFSRVSYIRADPAQMQMVLSAIVANSNEAIEDKGLIRITAENNNLDEDFTKQHPGLGPGYYVCLTIEDDGKDMDEETKSGIFEPFFTTKFQGRGMGMAAVYGIARNHDGWIYVDSELGRGATVRIYFPTIEIEIEKPKEAKADVSTGSGTILMIEDEDVVIEVTQAMLEVLGYRVMVAKTGKDAIHIAETFDGQIDLALLDIKFPDIAGRNLYPLIMKAGPDLKVFIIHIYIRFVPY